MTEKRIIQERENKLRILFDSGHNPYCNGFTPTISAELFLLKYKNFTREELTVCVIEYSIAGRIVFIRKIGKVSFFGIQDSGIYLQILITHNNLNLYYNNCLKLFDIGDFVYITGTPIRTKTGELSLNATSIKILTKAIRPFPEKYHGLVNVEHRYRYRYLDLISNQEARKTFLLRSQIIREIQFFLDKRGFIEVETPILNDTFGGAAAAPFETYHNSLSENLHLRIATELHLKRLVVGGFERVYEIGRLFRNEGISSRHNPEFTTLEFYQAYSTYEDLIKISEELLKHLAFIVHKKLTFAYGNYQISFEGTFRRASIARLVGEFLGLSELEITKLENITDFQLALKIAKDRLIGDEIIDLTLKQHGNISDEIKSRNLAIHLLYLVFECEIESNLIQPTFVTDFPVSVSPLARQKDADPALVDRFELYCGGMEIANAFSELNNSKEQRQRFIDQSFAQTLDNNLQSIDEDFLRALEFAMPPTAGEGIGIDRLLMLLLNKQSIREVILFPKLRAK